MCRLIKENIVWDHPCRHNDYSFVMDKKYLKSWGEVTNVGDFHI